jgi:hypothetical protein
MIKYAALREMSGTEMKLCMEHLEPSKEWSLDRYEDGPQLGFVHDGVFITDPTRSDCGRFDEDPICTYGLTPTGIVTLMLINGILTERANHD